MDRQNAGLGAILVAFFGAVFLASTARIGPQADATAASGGSLSRAVAKHAFPEHTGVDMIMDFLDADSDQTELKLPWSSKEPWPKDDSSWPKADSRGSYKTGYIIATLPDPSEPLLSNKFDLRLDAIQRAAADEGYLLDTVDLPWAYPDSGNGSRFKLGEEFDIEAKQEPHWELGDTAAPTPTPSSTPGNLSRRGQRHRQITARQTATAPATESATTPSIAITPHTDRSAQYPGLMLFRNDEKGLLLLVYLVSETPTSGINKTEMREALDEVAWLSGWTEPTPNYLPKLDGDQDELRILGPSGLGGFDSLSFTIRSWLDSLEGERDELRIPELAGLGSVDSLRYIISSWLGPAGPGDDIKIRIVSGSTSVPAEKTFGENTLFSSTLSPVSTEAISYALCHAVSAGDEAKALFIEGSTAYGAKVTRQAIEGSIAYRAKVTRQASDSLCGNGSEYALIRFPLHIASLREAARNDTTPDISKVLQLGPSNIPLSVNEGEAGYLARPYSSRSAIYDDVSLSREIAELNRQGIRYVGIVATDVVDRLFLVRRIQAEMPNANIFLVSNDLLYLHSDFIADTFGALVVSTYPLFGANQLWTYPFRGGDTPEYFLNESAEGVFNAMMALLGDYQKMVDYSAPFDSMPEPPGIWVSVVGRTAIWPLAFFAPDTLGEKEKSNMSASMVNADPDSHRRKDIGDKSSPVENLTQIFVPRAFSIFFAWLTLASGLFAIALLGISLKIRWLERLTPDWFLNRFGDATFKEFRDQQRLNAAAFGAYLTLMYLAFVGIAAIPRFYFPIRSAPLPRGASLLFDVSVVVLILLLVGFAGRIKARKSGARTPGHHVAKWLLSANWLFLLIFTLAFLLSISWSDKTSALLLFLRATSLRSGVSPLAPILYVSSAALVLTWCSLDRLYWGQHRRMTPPPPKIFCREDGTRIKAIKALFLDLDNHSFEGVSALETRVAKLVSGNIFSFDLSLWIVPLIAALVFAFYMTILSPIRRSFDGTWFMVLFLLASTVIYFGLAASLVRMLELWWATKRLLRRLYWHPSRNAYENFRVKGILPGVASENETRRTVGFDLWDTHSTWTSIEFGIETARRLLEKWDPKAGRPGEQKQFDDLKRDVDKAQIWLRKAETSSAEEDTASAIKQRFYAQSRMSRVVRRVSLLAASLWQSDGTPSPQIPPEVLLKEGELMLANRVLDLIRHVFPHLINLATTTTVGLIIMLVAVSSYDFPSDRFLLWYSWAFVLSVVSVILYIFGAINRDRILSLLTGATPGSLNFSAGFALQILLFGAVPILAILGVQFPGHLGQLFAWVSRVGPSHAS
jgi:hypothetical protein